jgi:hypothetical protein
MRATLLVVINCLILLLVTAYGVETYLRIRTKLENPAIEPARRAGPPGRPSFGA